MAAAKFKEGDKVKLVGTKKQTGVIQSVEGTTATVEWDTKSAVGARVDVSALAKK